MRESYSFNIDHEENGIVPLSTGQDQAISSEKRMTQLLADDLRRFIRGEKGMHKWQLVDKAGKPTDMKSAISALDAKPKQRAPSSLLPKNKAAQKRENTVPPLARQQQSQQSKANLIDRLYGGKGSLEAKFWPDA